MMAVLKLAYRNALRNRRRSLLTSATVAIGTAFTVVTLAFLFGIFDGMTRNWTDAFGPVRVVTEAYAEREQLQPLHENIPEVAPLLEQLQGEEGIRGAYPLFRSGVLVSIGEELGEDAALMVASSEEWFQRYVLEEAEFLGGSWLEPGAEQEQVVLGGKVARDLQAEVGSEILILGFTQYGSMAPVSAEVVGILTGNVTLDAQIFVTLETARWVTDIPEGALEILVYPEDMDDESVAETSARVSELLGEGYSVQSWFLRDIWLTTKPISDAMSSVLSVIIVLVMALAIFNTMTMSVLERTGEIGVMRAMGQTRLGAVAVFLLESMLLGIAGGVVGALGGLLPALYLEKNGVSFQQDVLDDMGPSYAMSETIYADWTPEIMMTALIIGIATASLGALLPALRAARIAPYEAMRAGR